MYMHDKKRIGVACDIIKLHIMLCEEFYVKIYAVVLGGGTISSTRVIQLYMIMKPEKMNESLPIYDAPLNGYQVHCG